MNVSPNQHDPMAVLGENTLKCSLTTSEGTSAKRKKAGGDREGLPPLFEKTDICLDERKEEKLSPYKLSNHLPQV